MEIQSPFGLCQAQRYVYRPCASNRRRIGGPNDQGLSYAGAASRITGHLSLSPQSEGKPFGQAYFSLFWAYGWNHSSRKYPYTHAPTRKRDTCFRKDVPTG